MVTTLSRLLRKDLWQMRAQVFAAAMVVACGVATFVAMRSTYAALLHAQQDYYMSYRFADLFVHLKRAPLSVSSRIAVLPGVTRSEARVVFDVMLDVPRLAEPATGRVVSVPEQGWPALNLLHLQSGRYAEPGRDDEILVSAAFAEANGLHTGDGIGAVINGRWKHFRIVGIALSPEYIYEAGAGSIFPDNRHYGVLWMGKDAVAAAFRMEGAFNDLVLALDGSVSPREVTTAVDRLLAPYGGLGAIGREEQVSHRFISDEIAQNRITATYVPAIFFFVAMFLLHNVLSRLIDMQRTQIGLLKAFGYGNQRIGAHYLTFACVVVVVGAIIGAAAGMLLGSRLTAMYATYYRFPRLEYRVDVSVIVGVVFLSLATAVFGAWTSVRKAIRLMPVEALHAQLPQRFAAGWGERAGLYRHLSVTSRMIARNIVRRPVKAWLSLLAIASAAAILVVGGFFFDAIDRLFDIQFRLIERQDVTVMFAQPVSHRAMYSLKSMPGVLRVEPFRELPVKLTSGYRSRRTTLSGIVPVPGMHQLIDDQFRPLRAPPDGILLSSRLAATLGVRAGDMLTVEMLEGERRVRQIRVAGLVGDLVGIRAYMDQNALGRLAGEAMTWSGAYLAVDRPFLGQLYATLKQTPAISAVALRQSVIDSFRKIVDESVRLSTSINVAFACIITFGVAFNGARIAYSERIQQLASLRVLGFGRSEVAWILLGEQFALAALAVPLGLLLGYGTCAWLVERLQTDLYRIPLVIGAPTLAAAALVTLGAVACSGALVAWRIRRLDLIAVLKARES
ncbi:ABC transporter permease [Paraburkholderia sp. UYCP14C]|uniref:ABC transporter permease n=1 Tax=Paraburkholderia sp. UYCP14C TaxID=2511130 RepID=UPI001020F270|nr:ABC transporter permease [Paraburkholderia sp. UYCP14C]RZF31246.1 ABC transporter permease [Paraburkholderia sp. UYCP14C]